MTWLAVIGVVLSGLAFASSRRDRQRIDRTLARHAEIRDPLLETLRSKWTRSEVHLRTNRYLLLVGLALIAISGALPDLPTRVRGSLIVAEMSLGLVYLVLGMVSAYHEAALEMHLDELDANRPAQPPAAT